MRTLILGGFSEFAKRAVVERSIMQSHNAKITVLLNGEEDFVTGGCGRDKDVQVEMFGEGCFCCTLRDPLTVSLQIQKVERIPDLLIIVTSVITDIDSVRGLIDQVLGEGLDVVSYFTLDLENAIALIDTFGEMIVRNVRSSDSVLLVSNASTSLGSKKEVIHRLKGIAPGLEEVTSHGTENKNIFFLRLNSEL